jgi:hypothetical protein
MYALLPQFVPYCIVLVLCQAVMSKFLRIPIVPVKHILDTLCLIVLPEALLAAILRLELRVILLNQVELYNSVIRLNVMRQVMRGLA